MRSQSLLRKSHSLIKRSGALHGLSPILQSRPPSSLRFKHLRPTSDNQIRNRPLSSTSAPPPTEPNVEPSEESSSAPTPKDAAPAAGPPEPPVASEEQDKTVPKTRRTRISSSSSSAKDSDMPDLPEGLETEILYTPEQSFMDTSNPGIPHPEMFEEALDKLLITLHPQIQARAMHPSAGSPRAVEPTLGLYCPIEGGDYVIDMTVHELAYRTGAEILILDAVQLAAGESGIFGKAASALNLPKNPLHFSSPSPPSPEAPRRQLPDEDDYDDEMPILANPPRMSISLPKLLTSLPGRPMISSSSRKPPTPSKLELFFDALVNLQSRPENVEGSTPSAVRNRSRLIYIRDFPTLASSSATWYPALLNAVRQRRRGFLARNSNISASPVTIIFGMAPSIAAPWHDGNSGSSSLINLLMNRNSMSSQMPSGAKSDICHDWTESDVAETAREKRLRSRLKKWEKNAASLQSEFPRLTGEQDDGDRSDAPDIIVIGGPKPSSPSGSGVIGIGVSEESADASSQFFRSAILVPQTRSATIERERRMSRRREINELTIRMAVGGVGGVMDSEPAFPAQETLADETPVEEPPVVQSSSDSPMWDEWSNKIEAWSNVRKIADRAVGSVMLSQLPKDTLSLAAIPVPWSAVQSAWTASGSLGTTRKKWLHEALGTKAGSEDHMEGEETLVNGAGSSKDKVVEGIKNDPDLDAHEARLLSCIVDANSMSTTFNQVHLPGHTIDAVRTIVSLPLLHPHAFQQGILKEHSMTGCLLFGPPGTGKTLVVRALAKEAGCRMLAVSPSDVMDMYVGEGEKLVRAVFALARKLSPCVVFLDEIDALFGARMSARESGSAFAHRGVITEFMQEMDGLKSAKDNVVVIGATNRPFDLDDAVLRRLPRRLLVDLPGEKERVEILKILLRDEGLGEDVSIDALARKTEGFSGSDLKHLCVSAALDSVKEHLELPWLSRHGTQHTSAANSEFVRPGTPSSDSASETSTNGPETDKEAVSESLEKEKSPPETASPAEKGPSTSPETPAVARVLRLHNFTQALKEITPSSSETLGSLADLRKWNEEFGEGRRDQKKRQVWGKGRFGFINTTAAIVEDGRVATQ